MSGDPASRRPPVLLPGAAGPAPLLALAVALLSILAASEVVLAGAAVRASQAWSNRLAGSATLAAAGQGLESADAAAARAVEILARDPRVARAWVLDPAPEDGVAAGVMGVADSGPADSPAADGPPRLIAVSTRPGAEIKGADMVEIVRAAGVNAAVDDHGLWTGPLRRAAVLTAIGAVAGLVALTAGLVAFSFIGARRAVARSKPRVILLAQFGADEAALVGPFRAGVGLSVLLGAVLGVGAVSLAAGAMVWSPPAAIWLMSLGVTPPRLSPWDAALVWIWPVPAALVGLAAADWAARSRLRTLT